MRTGTLSRLVATAFVGTLVGSLLTLYGPAASAAPASTARTSTSVEPLSTVYIPGQDVALGSCKGWMNRRTTDNYVQALGQSWGDECEFWLERKAIGSYDWTQVSDTYLVLNASLSTGFHWNGTNAGSRVCLRNLSIGDVTHCSSGYW
jgi:hypothetical protein